MLQQLRLILGAEADGRERVETARGEAERLLAAAEEEARRLRREAHENRATVTRAVEEGLLAAAREQAARIEAETRGREAALRAAAEPRLERAAAAFLAALLPARSDGGGDGHG